jgi:microcystin-dependent protein
MSYFSGIDQRVRQQQFFNNSSTITQPANQSDTLLLANLQYVQNWFNTNILSYLTVNNPTFTGTLSTVSGTASLPTANITTSNNTTSNITTANITTGNITNQNGTLFSQNPSITINNKNYQVGFRVVGEIKMICTNTSVPNYLNCDGGSYSTTAYPSLFTAIGYAYGGSGASFNVPNFASHFPIGNNGSKNGVPSSNYATGNGQGGYTNTQLISYNYLNSSNNAPALLQSVPQHSHNTIYLDSNLSTITPVGVQQYLFSQSGGSGIPTEQTGTNIQTTDPISGGNGVNITPPYVAVAYFICYA